ncbi:MAG: patatin-like phospholipase family protein [Spirochaetales bacterium]|nr:patatin-like phospholipase family protein [Spirochaetales bacterium]
MKRLVVLFGIMLLSASLLFASGPSVALVLSGGGARGIAHIAVLEALEEEGIPIDLIVGTSIGSLIGGMYSVGYTPGEIREILFDLDMIELFSEAVTEEEGTLDHAFVPDRNHVFDLRFSDSAIGRNPAIIGDQRILELLGFLFAKYPNPIDFDELPIPFRAISADIMSGEEIVHDSGSLVRAIRASISIPLVFAPFPLEDGRLAIDGGAVDNLPIDIARALGAEYVIASDLNAFINEDKTRAESLSGVVLHSLALVTQRSASAQHESADLLFTSDLHDIPVIDVFRLNEIDRRGEEAVERNRAQLQAFGKRLEAERGLVAYDPDRVGLYARLPDPTIRSVAIENISLNPGPLFFDEGLFEFMVGSPLDEEHATELALRLRQVRKQNSLASLSFEMKEGGTLGILARSFGRTGNRIAMGFIVGMGVSNTLNETYVWYKANAYLDAALVHIGRNNLSYTLASSLGEETAVTLGLVVPLGDHRLGALIGYGSGALTPRTSVVNAARTAPLDRRIRTEFSYGYSIGRWTSVELALRGDFFFIHDSVLDKPFVAYPHAELSFVHCALKKQLGQEGIRIESSFIAGYDKRLVYSGRLRLIHHIRLSFLDTLGYLIEVARLDGPRELIGSFAEVVVPGYAPHTFKRDLIQVGMHYQRYLFDVFSYPSYLRFDVIGAWANRGNPIVRVIPPRVRFMELEPFDLGFGASYCVQTPIGDLIFSLGVSIDGAWGISMGIS